LSELCPKGPLRGHLIAALRRAQSALIKLDAAHLFRKWCLAKRGTAFGLEGTRNGYFAKPNSTKN